VWTYAIGVIIRLVLAGVVFLVLSQLGLTALLFGLAGFLLARWHLLARLGGICHEE
jgi:hypothetical protein